MWNKMLSPKLDAALDKNADMWHLPPTEGQTTLYTGLIVATLILYTVALTIVLLCATGGGALVADRIATDPAVFSDDAWIIPVINFSITLIHITWTALIALFCISYPLAFGVHVLRLRQHTQPKNEV